MAQAVSRQLLPGEARVRARVIRCVIHGGQSGTGTGFITHRYEHMTYIRRGAAVALKGLFATLLLPSK
jgi:hypothetical protein